MLHSSFSPVGAHYTHSITHVPAGVAVSSDGISWNRGHGLIEGAMGAAKEEDLGAVLRPNPDWWTCDTAGLSVSDVQVGVGRGGNHRFDSVNQGITRRHVPGSPRQGISWVLHHSIWQAPCQPSYRTVICLPVPGHIEPIAWMSFYNASCEFGAHILVQHVQPVVLCFGLWLHSLKFGTLQSRLSHVDWPISTRTVLLQCSFTVKEVEQSFAHCCRSMLGGLGHVASRTLCMNLRLELFEAL
jgi:hypothetical protein